MEEGELVFITGVGRSGTTLLQNMLQAHSQINFPPETHFFKRYIVPFLIRGKLPATERLQADSYLGRLDHDLKESIYARRYQELEDLRQAFLQIMASGSGAAVIGDKDTEYVRYLPHLRRVFPKSKLIHMIRDPRDVVASRLKTEWGKNRSLAFHAGEYEYYLKATLKQGPREFAGDYYELCYEFLLNSPEAEVKGLLEFLGLPYEENCLNYHQQKQSLVADDEKNWKGNVDQPLMKDNVQKWRKSLNPEDAALIESGLKSFMKAYNYSVSDKQPALIGLIVKKLVKQAFAWKTYRERLRD